MSDPRPADAGALYETLSRFQWWRRRWSRAQPGEGLELRKRLQSPQKRGDGPSDGASGLDSWLFALLGNRPAARILDLGCGFGITAQRWARFGGGTTTGITQSAFQVAKATAAAALAQLGDRCRFVRQDFTASLPGPFDVVLAIEALGHAAELRPVLQNVRAALAPGGTFLWLEDLLVQPLDRDAGGDPDVAEIARRWCSPPLRDAATARVELAAAGFLILREIDLTSQVTVASIPRLQGQARRLARWRAGIPLPYTRRLFDAFLGGLALERLYARGATCYRVWMCERPMEVT